MLEQLHTCQNGDANICEEEPNAAPALVLGSTDEAVDGTLLGTAGGCAVCGSAHPGHLVGDVRLSWCCVIYSGIGVKGHIQGVNLLALSAQDQASTQNKLHI